MARSNSCSGARFVRLSASDETGIRSSSRIVPSSVVKVVSKTFVSSTYRLTLVKDSRGRTVKEPPRSRSSSAANSDGLSKRGRHSQSSDPSRATNAAERQSPMIA